MYVPGIFHGVRFVENERHADRRECFLLNVFCWRFLYDCFSLFVFRYAFLVVRFSLFVFRYAFSHERFSLFVFRYAFSHFLLIIPIIGDCEQYSLRSTFAAVFV